MEPLKDPLQNRQIKSIIPPPYEALSSRLLWSNSKKEDIPDWKILANHLRREGRLHKKDAIKLIRYATNILKKEGNLLFI